MADETKAGGEEEAIKQNVVEQVQAFSREESPLVSVVKPAVQEWTQNVQSLVQNAADRSSSYVDKGIANLAQWTSPRKSEPVQESSDAPAQQENADLDEHSRAIHTQGQPFVAEARASWTNCCGLLDVLKPSDR